MVNLGFYAQKSANFTAFEAYLNSIGYNKRDGPSQLPIDVSAQIGIVSLGPINKKELNLKICFYFRTFWTDGKLALSPAQGKTIVKMNHADTSGILWIPDLFVDNSKTLHRNIAQQETSFISIKDTGIVTFSPYQWGSVFPSLFS